MDQPIINTIIASSGTLIASVAGMFFMTNQLGKRIDDLNQNMRDFRAEFNSFRDAVNGKLAAMDLEIARLMDRLK